MKRLLAIVAVLLVLCAFVVPVNAEETPITPPATENTTHETNAPTEPENAPAESAADFFDRVIVPALVSVGAVIASCPIWGAALLKAFSKAKAYAAALKQKTEECDNLKKLLETTDVAEFKSALSALLTEDLKKAIDKVKIDEKTIVELTATVETINARLENFMKAAENAWGASPAALSLLTSAESTAIKTMAAKITSYENYIRAEKGAEAEGIIRDIEGV